MTKLQIHKLLLSALLVTTSGMTALAADDSAYGDTFLVTINNGSDMPISPGVFYTTKDSDVAARLGTAPTSGFVRLCTMGDPGERSSELKSMQGVMSVQKTNADILPGQSLAIDVKIDPRWRNLHFEAMYGKTKDVCAVSTILAQDLRSLDSKSRPNLTQRDHVVRTGAFQPAMLPADTGNLCTSAATAVDCLRMLSMKSSSPAMIGRFSPYLPSVVNFLEQRYGAMDTQSLIIPSAGAVSFRVMRH